MVESVAPEEPPPTSGVGGGQQNMAGVKDSSAGTKAILQPMKNLPKWREMFTLAVLPVSLINQVWTVEPKAPAAASVDKSVSIELAWDKNSAFGVKDNDLSVSITPGRSRYEERVIKERQERQKREVIARESVSRFEPSTESKRALVKRAAAKYNLDWKTLLAVWQVESGQSWDTFRRSSAGATGPWQFMPGTWRKYAEDANNDGSVDITSAEDGAYAAAKLLAANNGAVNIDQALFSYNHSGAYVKKVKQIAASVTD